MNMKEQNNKLTNVFLIEVDRAFWFDVWKKLVNEMRLKVQLLTTAKELMEDARISFPEARILSSKESMRGIYPKEYANLELSAVDAEIIDLYSESHLLTLQMMDCMDLDEYVRISERLNIYKKHLKYWIGAIENLNPGLIFFPTAPHEVYDYVIYQICKKRGIKALFFEYTSVGTLFIRKDLSDFGHIGRCYSELLKSESVNSELSENLSREYKKLKREYSEGKPYFMKEYF